MNFLVYSYLVYSYLVYSYLVYLYLVYSYLVYLFTVEQVEDMRNLNKIGGISTIKTSKLGIAILIFAILVLSSICTIFK